MVAQLRESNRVAGPEAWLRSAQRTLATGLGGLGELATAFDGELGAGFCAAVSLIRSTQGRVILTGIGKSGHIARKIASTMASTGTPAMYVHPVEASHGDLGMITSKDVIVMISNSGETAELRAMLDYAKRFAVKIIAMTSRERARKQERAMVTIDQASSDPLGAISASLFLTGIFLLIAIFAGFEADPKQGIAYNGVQGMMYAGLGAYVAVLYYMVARLYANALSSRFLLS